MTTSFIEKMAESIKTAIEIFGIVGDAVVASDGMVIVMNPKEKHQKKMVANSHGGFAGKSLIEKIRDDLDEMFIEYKDAVKENELGGNGLAVCQKESFVEGMCQAMGIMRSTTCDEEWKLAEFRYEQQREKEGVKK